MQPELTLSVQVNKERLTVGSTDLFFSKASAAVMQLLAERHAFTSDDVMDVLKRDPELEGDPTDPGLLAQLSPL